MTEDCWVVDSVAKKALARQVICVPCALDEQLELAVELLELEELEELLEDELEALEELLDEPEPSPPPHAESASTAAMQSPSTP